MGVNICKFNISLYSSHSGKRGVNSTKAKQTRFLEKEVFFFQSREGG